MSKNYETFATLLKVGAPRPAVEIKMRTAGISDEDINYWFTYGTIRPESNVIDDGNVLNSSNNSIDVSHNATFYSTQGDNDNIYNEEIDREVNGDYRSDDEDSDDYIDSVLDEKNFNQNTSSLSDMDGQSIIQSIDQAIRSPPPPPPIFGDNINSQSRRSSISDSVNQSTRSPPPPPSVAANILNAQSRSPPPPPSVAVDILNAQSRSPPPPPSIAADILNAQSRRSSISDSVNQSTRSPPPPPSVAADILNAQSRSPPPPPSVAADILNAQSRSPPPPPPVFTNDLNSQSRRHSLNVSTSKCISQESVIEGYSKFIDEIVTKLSLPSAADTKLIKELDNLLAKKENDLARTKKESLVEPNPDEVKLKEKLLGVHKEVYNDFISQSSVMAYPVGQFAKLLPHYQVHNNSDSLINSQIHDINERLHLYATERLTRHHHMIVDSLTERIDIHINGMHKACGEMQKFIHKEKLNYRSVHGANESEIEKSIEKDYSNTYKYYKNIEKDSNVSTDKNMKLCMDAISEIDKWAIERIQLMLQKSNSIKENGKSDAIDERVSQFCDFYLDQLSRQLSILQHHKSNMNGAIIENALWKKDTVVMNQDWLTSTVSGIERIYCNEMEVIMSKLLDHGRIKNEWMVNSIPTNNYNLVSGGMTKIPVLPLGDRIKDLGVINELDYRKIEDYLLQILRS